MSKKNYPKPDSRPIDLEKLAVASSEIDNHTGRIILPSADELNSLKKASNVATKKKAVQKPIQDLEPQAEQTLDSKPIVPNESNVTKNSSEALTQNKTIFQGSGTSILATIGLLGMLVGCLLIATLIWVGSEVRLTRLAMEQQNNIALIAATPKTANLKNNEELSLLILSAEQLAVDLTKTLKKVDGNVADLQEEVSDLEYKIFEPVTDIEDEPVAANRD